ncbi:PAS domain-containing protein [Streptomyces xantholiticus]
MAVVDTDLRYILANRAMEVIDGLPADDHLRRHIHETQPFATVRQLEEAAQAEQFRFRRGQGRASLSSGD